MNSGCPPTDLKARTGLFTPPGNTRSDCSNSAVDRSVFRRVCMVSPPWLGRWAPRAAAARPRSVLLRGPRLGDGQVRGACVGSVQAEQVARGAGIALPVRAAAATLQPHDRLVEQ